MPIKKEESAAPVRYRVLASMISGDAACPNGYLRGQAYVPAEGVDVTRLVDLGAIERIREEAKE